MSVRSVRVRCTVVFRRRPSQYGSIGLILRLAVDVASSLCVLWIAAALQPVCKQQWLPARGRLQLGRCWLLPVACCLVYPGRVLLYVRISRIRSSSQAAGQGWSIAAAAMQRASITYTSSTPLAVIAGCTCSSQVRGFHWRSRFVSQLGVQACCTYDIMEVCSHAVCC